MACAIAVAGCLAEMHVAAARQASGRPAFEVISIRPTADPQVPRLLVEIRARPGGRLEVTDASLRNVIAWAYALGAGQRVIGGQAVLDSRFVIQAKAATDLPLPRDGDAAAPFRLMTQTLLSERFGLRVSWKEEDVPAMAVKRIDQVRVGRGLVPLDGPCADVVAARAAANDNRGPTRCGVFLTNGRLTAAVDRLQLALDVLSALSHTRFVDETGLAGGFQIAMSFDVSTLREGLRGDPTLPSFSEALRNELGLRVEQQRSRVRNLVVEQVTPPTDN
jgi:uncharacterized protein (TIGR03435 family)